MGDPDSGNENLEVGKHAQEEPSSSLAVAVHAALVVVVETVVLAGNELMSVAEVVHFPYFPYCPVVVAVLENDFDVATIVDGEDHPESSAYLKHPNYFRPLMLMDLPEKMRQKMGYWLARKAACLEVGVD